MNKWMEAIGQTIFYIVLYFAVSIISPQILTRIGQDVTVINQLLMGSLLFIALVLLINRESLGKKGWFTRFNKKELGKTLELAVATVIIVNFFLVFIFPDFINGYMPDTIKKQFEALTQSSPFLLLFAVGVLAPFTEELLFRGAIYNLLKDKINVYVAIGLSALLFAVVHMNLYQGSYTIFIGLFLGIILWKSGSLWLTVIFHIVYNTLGGLFGAVDSRLLEFLFVKTYIAPIIGVIMMIDSLRFFLIKGGKR